MFHYRHAWFHNGGPNRSRPSHRYLALRTGVDRMEILTTRVQVVVALRTEMIRCCAPF